MPGCRAAHQLADLDEEQPIEGAAGAGRVGSEAWAPAGARAPKAGQRPERTVAYYAPMLSTLSVKPSPLSAGSDGRWRLRILYTPGSSAPWLQAGHELSTGATRLGREPGPGSAVQFADPCASRKHAEVVLDDKGVVIRDCGSHNGTLINGERLQPAETRWLREGDLLRVGNTFLLLRHEASSPDDADVPEIIGVSSAARMLRCQVTRLAGGDQAVLLLGETGTGKELIASALHRLSRRPGERVSVNCSAIPATLAESLLFGHIAGAFSGAIAQPGYFRAAHRGTLFLDEVGDLAADLQPKLLRALEDHAVTPVGATSPVPCRVRVLSATNRDLSLALARGEFREDLYARLSGFILPLPPLRERREDILMLLQHAYGSSPIELPEDLVDQLLRYKWPRNVREIYKVAEHVRVFGPDEVLRARLKRSSASPEGLAVHQSATAAMPAALSQPVADRRPNRLVKPSADELTRLMQTHKGVIQDVAEVLGCSRRQVGRWLEDYCLGRTDFRSR